MSERFDAVEVIRTKRDRGDLTDVLRLLGIPESEWN